MPSEAFRQWADSFNRRYRFGIPVLPPPPREEAPQVPPTIVKLPARAGSMRFTDEDVTAVRELLAQCEPGQAVRLTDDPDDSDNTARRRSELMKEQLGSDSIKDGYKVRGHVLTEGEPTVTEHTSKKSGKSYKITTHPKNWAAVSLVPENTPDETPPDMDPDASPDVSPDTDGAAPDSPPDVSPPAEEPAETPAATTRRRR